MNKLSEICDPRTIRSRTAEIFEAAKDGSTAFAVDLSKLGACVDLVMSVTTRNYPDGVIPVHGRYEHFRAGGVDRVATLQKKLSGMNAVDRAKAMIDVTLVSVLLDAGAGDHWKYIEDGKVYSRSEGLALASLAMFEAGAFSSDETKPYQCDAQGLEKLTTQDIARGFQVSDTNPLAGLEGRSSLLVRLADSMRAWPQFFGTTNQRPGNLIDALSAKGSIQAQDVLELLLLGLSKMWPARSTVENIGFGDVWNYHGRLIPFHKLSQWLTYSLIEPIEASGIKVAGLGELTGLPEYRNGGLFLDTEVLRLRDPKLAERELEASDSAIIEWRALTVQLLDLVWVDVCKRLGKSKEDLPLARVLQGGTWAAGREIAKRLRPATGGPPLRLKSDGMVF